MNILEIAFSDSWGGLEMLAGTFAERFKQKGHNVISVIEPNKRLEGIFRKSDIEYFKIKPYFKYIDFFTADKIRKYLAGTKIDIIHAHISKDLSTIVILKKLLKSGKIVFTQHMDSKYDKKDLFHRWIYKNLDQVISITNSMRQNHIEHSPVDTDKICVIHNGIDLNRFSTDLNFDKIKFLNGHSIPENRILIGTIGRIDRLKKQELLIYAAEKLVRNYPRIHFIFVGDETDSVTGKGYREELREKIRARGLEKYFSIFNYSGEVEKFFSVLDVFVLTTPRESFGLVLLEAMAVGIPVLGSCMGSPPEIIRDNINGFIFNPDNVSDLTGKLSKILSDPNLRNKMGEKSREIVKENFDLNQKIDDYLKTFQGII